VDSLFALSPEWLDSLSAMVYLLLKVFLDALFPPRPGRAPGKFRAIVIVQTGDVPFVRARQSCSDCTTSTESGDACAEAIARLGSVCSAKSMLLRATRPLGGDCIQQGGCARPSRSARADFPGARGSA